MSEHPGDTYATYFAAEKLEQEVRSVLIAYRLTLGGAQPTESTPWHRDSSMQPYPLRVRTGEDEVTLSVADWAGRHGEVRPFLREWIHRRVHLERTRLKSTFRWRDPYWVDAWRRAHRWG